MSIFQLVQSDIVDNVSLSDLIPQLNSENLLSERDEQLLTNQSRTEYDRKLELTSILRRKGPDAVRKFVRCLRKRENLGHSHLADLIEAKLAERGSRLGEAPVVVGCGSSSGPCSSETTRAPSLSSYPPQQPLPPNYIPNHFTSGYIESSPTCQLPPFPPGQSQVSPSSSVAHNPPSDVRSDPSPAASSTSDAESVEFAPSVEVQDFTSLSQQYATLVGEISTALVSRGLPFASVKQVLVSILQECGILSLVIPPDIAAIPALLQFLNARRMCHEYDVDLLCEMLRRLNQLDLQQEVLAHSQSIMQHNVLQCGSAHTRPTPHQFLAFTVHNVPALTYAQACEVKDVLSNLLGVDRHTFWLSSAESGSVVLGWRFREELAKGVRTRLEDDAVQRELVSAGKMHSLTGIETLFPGAEQRHTVFSIQGSSSVPQSPVQIQQSTVRLLSSHLMEEEEECEVTSSTADLPAPMDVESQTERQSLRAGTKRKHTSNVPDSSDVETDGIKRPTSKRRKANIVVPPQPKRKALLTGAQGGSGAGLHIEGVSPQQFSEQHVTPSFQRTEHESDYRRALRDNEPLIVSSLNLMSILPHLNACSLLTEAENDEMRLRDVPEHDKIGKLVGILVRKGEEGFHKFIAALERASDHLTHKTIAETLKQSLKKFPLSNKPPSFLVDHLRDWYRNAHFFTGAAGPHIKDIQFIRLALVKKKGVSEEDKWRDKFLKATLHGHLEDIYKKKVQLEMMDIFRYRKKEEKLVLVEGAPGVGKTMLAMKLCVDWAKGETLQEYDIVLFVELRRFQSESKLTLKTIVGALLEEDEEMTRKVVQYFVKTRGERLLIILEGWDELSPSLRRQHSWFFDLIKRNNLPRASVMVTSRPSVTAPLYDYMDERRVEVLGFNEDQQREYISRNISDVETAQRVLDHLKKFPNLRALAHIPLTLAIVCFVAMQSERLPVTLTELYKKYTCHLFLDHLRKNPEACLDTVQGLDSLDDLPEEESRILASLRKLALHGFEQKAFIFESHDLEQQGLPSNADFSGCGLLTTRTQLATAGRKPLYQFRHLSIQEYLAGLEINGLPAGERLRLLKEFRKDKQFQNIWKFLSGISRLQDEAFCCQLVGAVRKSSRDELFLLHCLYEAQNPEICHVAADKMERILHLDNATLNATDCLCVAYVMGSAKGDWQVNLRGCNIGGEGLEVFKWQLKAHDSPDLKIAVLDLTHNQLDAAAMDHLSDMLLQLKAKIIRVKVETNKIGDEGVRVLSSALKNERVTVEELHFRECGLTSEAAKWFAEILKHKTALNSVYFGFDRLGDEGAQYIASALHDNATLKELGLASVGLTSVGLTHLADALKINHTLKIIRIDRNELSVSECHIIAEILTHGSLDLLDISRNPIGMSIILDALIKKPDALKKLGAYGCNVTSREIHKFVKIFQKTTVFKGMHIGLNPIGDAGAEYIAQAVEENKSESIKELYMDNTNLTEKGKQRIMGAKALRGDLYVTFAQNAAVERMRERMREELRPQ